MSEKQMPQDLSSHPDSIRAVKKPIPLQVRFAACDGVTETIEGKVTHRCGDAIITGTHNERWPVQRKKFDASYRPVPPLKAGDDGLYTKRPFVVLALQLKSPFSIKVGWQDDPLHGKPGDWLLQYDTDNYGIVANAIFAETYDVIDHE